MKDIQRRCNISHTSKYKCRIKNIDMLKAVLDDKGITYRENCTVNLYGSNRAKAELAFKLDGWQYECAVTADGEILYDHYGSKHGTKGLLGETVKEYNKQSIMAKVWGAGFVMNSWEEEVKDGTKIVIEVM